MRTEERSGRARSSPTWPAAGLTASIVLISVIAPDFVADKPADLAALAITLLAATRLSMLPTVLIGVVSAGVLRFLMGLLPVRRARPGARLWRSRAIPRCCVPPAGTGTAR